MYKIKLSLAVILTLTSLYGIDKPFEFHKLVVDGQPIIPFPKKDISKSLGGDKDDIKAMTDGIGLFIDRPDFTKATNQSISVNSSFVNKVIDKFKKPAEAENLSVEDYINNHWDELDDSTKAWLLSGLVETPLIKQEDLSNPPYFTTIPPINYVLGDPNRGSYVLPLSWFPVKDDDSDISFTLKNEYNSEFGSLYNGDTKLVPGSSFKYSDIENGLIKFVPNYGTIDSNPSKTSSVGNIGAISESSFDNGYLTDPYIDGNYKVEFNFTSGKYMGSFSNELAPILAPSNKCSVTAGECNYMEQLGYSGVQYLLDFNGDPKKCIKVWLPDSTNSSDGYNKSYTIETSKDVYGYSLSDTICKSIDVYSNNDTILAREVQFYPQGSLSGSSYINPQGRSYIVTSLPTDGTLYNNSTPLNVGDSFSDEDLKNGTIYSIANDGSSGVKDLTFGYNVEGNSKSSNSPISISQSSFSGIINNIDNDVPPIVTSSTPFNIDGGPVIVTNSMMGVTDPNGDSFTYNITDSGNGSFKDSSGNVVTSFTNNDLDNNSIQYVPNEGSISSTIVFNVNDNSGNSVINSRSVTLNYLSSPAAPTFLDSNYKIYKFVSNLFISPTDYSASDPNNDNIIYYIEDIKNLGGNFYKNNNILSINEQFSLTGSYLNDSIEYKNSNSGIETLDKIIFGVKDDKGYDNNQNKVLYVQNMGDLVFPGNGKHAGNTGIGHIEGSDWVVSKGETGTNSRGFALHSTDVWGFGLHYADEPKDVVFKIKVSDNSGHNKIGTINCTQNGITLKNNSLDIYTDDFKSPNVYQDFVITCNWTDYYNASGWGQFFGMDGIDSSFTDIYVRQVEILNENSVQLANCNTSQGIIYKSYSTANSTEIFGINGDFDGYYPLNKDDYDNFETFYTSNPLYYQGMTIIDSINTSTDSSNNNPIISDTDDKYMSIMSGYIYIPEAGTYEFGISGDDAVDFTINNQTIGYYGIHGDNGFDSNYTITISFDKKGYYPFKFRQQDWVYGDGYNLYWKKPGDSDFVNIPADNFYYCTDQYSTVMPNTTNISDVFGDNSSYTLITLDNNAQDANGTFNDINIYGDTTFDSGKFGNALDFGNVANNTNYLEIDNFVIPDSFTFNEWIYKYDNASDLTPFLSVSEQDNDNYFIFMDHDGGEPTYRYWYAGDKEIGAGTERLGLNNWHMVTISYDSHSNIIKMYIDGEKIYEANPSDPSELNNDYKLAVIGQEQDSVGGGFNSRQSLIGKVDQIRMFTKALSDDEVKLLYTNERN